MMSNVHNAKTNLSKLLDAAARGEEVVITRRGTGVNRFLLVPAPVVDRSKLFGILRDQIPDDTDYEAADEAFAELIDEYMDSLERGTDS